MTVAPGGRTRVVIADDHPIVTDGLTAVLAGAADLELVAVASDGGEAVDAALTHAADLVIMDLHMPTLDGIEATRRLTAERPEIAVLVLTMRDDDDGIRAALQAGARGYLVKGATRDAILAALRTVASGGIVFGGVAATQVVGRLTGQVERPFPALTAREAEILRLLAEGLGTEQIARREFLSPKTVRNHVSNVMTKLGVSDRAQAIAMARDAGWGA